VFGLDAGHLRWLRRSESDWLKYHEVSGKAAIIDKWEKEASQKDRVYILSGAGGGYDDLSNTVCYIED
jgi:CRISPR/Cas system CSM-associated protein Csm5 (group 7 of RAMP superfamily)